MSAVSAASTVAPDRAASGASSDKVDDAAMANLLNKVENMGAGMVRRTTSAPGVQSTSSMGLSPEQAAIIENMRKMQSGLGGFLDSSKKTMEASSSALWDHFKKIPHEKLQAHVILRFNAYDTDGSGSLDRDEMREAMAEMGRRPSETELDELMKVVDVDGDGTINLDEFSMYIFKQIGVKDTPKSKELRKAENTKKVFQRSPSAPSEFNRVKSSDSQKSVGHVKSADGGVVNEEEAKTVRPVKAAPVKAAPKKK